MTERWCLQLGIPESISRSRSLARPYLWHAYRRESVSLSRHGQQLSQYGILITENRHNLVMIFFSNL